MTTSSGLAPSRFTVSSAQKGGNRLKLQFSTFRLNVDLARYCWWLCPAGTKLNKTINHRQRRSTTFEQVYFYGELIPPYTDKLGRGALLRPTDSDNALYQAEAKCYRNLQALGSKVNQECIAYHGNPWVSYAMQIDLLVPGSLREKTCRVHEICSCVLPGEQGYDYAAVAILQTQTMYSEVFVPPLSIHLLTSSPERKPYADRGIQDSHCILVSP